MFQTLKSKIIVIYSVLSIAFLAALLSTVYVKEKDRVFKLALESTTEISKMHASLLSQEFRQYVSMLKMVSDDPQVKQGNSEHITTELNRLMSVGEGRFLNAIYVDQGFNLFDTKGFSGKVTHASFMSGKQWDGKSYNITSPIKSQFEEKLVCMVAVPIRGIEGEWEGTIAIAVSLETLSERLGFIKLTRGSYAWLTDKNGDVVAHPDKSVIMRINLSTAESFGFPGFAEVVRKVDVQEHGYGQYRDTNIHEDKVVTFSAVEYLPGWVLFVTTVESEIFSDIYAILYEVLSVSIVMIVVLLFFVNKLAKNIAAPIVQLTKEVKASTAHTDQTITVVESKDEIGVLSQVFASSLKRIHFHTHQLESLVKRRTEELEAKNIMLASQNKKLEDLATRDPLTNLYNRRAFGWFIDKEVSRVNRYGCSACFVIMDIDHFKSINDTHGHDVGDAVLCQFAKVITENSRNENIVCRWGGEEFVILMPESTIDMALVYLRNLRQAILTSDFDCTNKVRFSAGISTYVAGETVLDWTQRADRALYKAKHSGRDRVAVG